MNTTTPRRRGRPPGSKNKPKSSSASSRATKPTEPIGRVNERKAATYAKRLVALQKARAARAAKRAAAGIVSKPRTTTAGATSDQPTSGPAPYLLSDDYRLVALDHRNWALQKLRTSGEGATGEDGEDGGEEGSTDTWFSVGYFSSIQAACQQFAQRSAREAHGVTLPTAIAQACKSLNKLLVDIGEATKGI